MKTVFETFYEIVSIPKGDNPGFKEQDKSQTDEEYIRAFAVAISQIPDDVWNLLPSKATEWYDNTARCINNVRPFANWPRWEGFVRLHYNEIPEQHEVIADPQPVLPVYEMPPPEIKPRRVAAK